MITLEGGKKSKSTKGKEEKKRERENTVQLIVNRKKEINNTIKYKYITN